MLREAFVHFRVLFFHVNFTEPLFCGKLILHLGCLAVYFFICVALDIIICPIPPSTQVKSEHLLRLIELMTVTVDREEVNRYVNKQDVIFTYLPHLKGQVSIGR